MKKSLTGLIVVALMTIAVYWSGLEGGFFFDDMPNIVHEERLHIRQLDAVTLKQVLVSGHSGLSGRPVSQLSFAFNHYFSGLDPYVFKLTNLFIHIAGGVLVYLLAWRLLRMDCLRQGRSFNQYLPIVLVGIWMLHPIQLLPVLHVVQRMTSLSALFLLSALLLHIQGRESSGKSGVFKLVTAWGIFWPLSFLSKETGVLFPLFVLSWELIVRRGAAVKLDRFAGLLSILVATAVALSVAYAFLPVGQWLWAGYAMRDFSLTERVLTEGRVIWFYVGMILFPRLSDFGLQHDDLPLSTDLLTPWTTFPALIALAILVGLAWHNKKRFPLMSFGIAWFLIGHSLESTVLPLEIAHEHRNYLPLFGVLLVLIGVFDRLLREDGWKKTVALALIVAGLSYSTLLTGLRSHQFGDELRRTQIEAQHHPESSRAHYEAGLALAAHAVQTPVMSPLRFLAKTHYEQAAVLDLQAKLPWLGLMHLNCSANIYPEDAWLIEFKRRLRETPFAPGDKTVLYSVKEMAIAGTLCLDRSAITEIFSAAQGNLTVTPHVSAILHSWLADYLTLAAKDLSAAEVELNSSLAIVPHNLSNRLKRAQLIFLQGHHNEAKRMLLDIKDKGLLQTERETKSQLLECLSPVATTKCIFQ